MHRASPSVSIYMPMVMGGPGVQENPIRFKNLLKKAEELVGDGASGLLKPLEELVSDRDFWEERSPGLAVFHSPKLTKILRLPVAAQPIAAVEGRFHLKPLLAMVAEPGRFYVLALSQNATRLLEVTREQVTRIDDDEIPDSLDATLPIQFADKQLQYHSDGEGAPRYHGQGAGEGREAEDDRRFLAAVDDGLRKVVRDRDAPVVLAGVSELTAMFRELSDHPHIADGSVEGNVEALSDQALTERAYPVAEPALRQSRHRARARVDELAHTDRVAVGMEDVLRASFDGLVEVLFVTDGQRVWGNFDPGSRKVTVEDGQSDENVDLTDLAALRTYEQGGSVYMVEAAEMPKDTTPAVAILRY